MKNRLTITVFLSLSFGIFAQYGQLPNGSFESWSDQDVYDYPTLWTNFNTDFYQGIATVFQSSDAQNGMYSCEITAEAAGTQDTIVGYVYQGFVGTMGPAGGIPYNVNFDEMRYHYKCDLVPGDTLFVIATRFIAGVAVSTQILPAAFGTQSSWTAGSVSFTNGAQDDLFLGFTIGNPFGANVQSPGSWVKIDNITMHNAGFTVTNISDPSFEDWTPVITSNPDDWYSINNLLSYINAENLVQSTDANTGSYAVQMTTTQPFPGGDTIPAFLASGPFDFYAWNPFTSIPYEAVPTELTGAYKYAPVLGDQAFIQVSFYQNGNIIGYEFEPFNATASYQTFNLPISIAGVPDSMALMAYSGDNVGSVLLLDDLAFVGGNVGLDEFSTLNIDIYPNPATSSLMIQADGNYRFSIINLSGQEVLAQDKVQGAVELDISSLASGAYFVTITNEFKSESHKLIIE